MVKLDIACGQAKKEGFIGVDIARLPGVDIVHDLEQFPWPFDDNSIEEARCSHYVEHTKDLFKFLGEVYRILEPGGKILIIAPYYSSIRAWQDPTHTRAISEHTFLYCNRSWMEANKLTHYPISCNFDAAFEFDISQEWANRSKEAISFALKHYLNVAQNINVTLTKR